MAANEKLRRIMDYNRPYSMQFSGVESPKFFTILYDLGVRNFLMSYYYAKDKSDTALQAYKDAGVKFFIDSGVYTFLTEFDEHTLKPVEFWEQYIQDYLDWCRKHQEVIFAIANLDISALVGTQQVEVWNQKYFEPFMLETKIPVCFIWHEYDTLDYWHRMCERYPYVGFPWGSDSNSDMDLSYASKLIAIAENYNAVVHGMGMTRTSLLPKLPFYTSDSTTWLVGGQYGEINYWTGSKMMRLKKDKWRGEYLKRIIALHPTLTEELLLAEDYETLLRANVIAFQKAEEFVQTRMKSKMYWMKPEMIKTDSLSDVSFPPFEWITTAGAVSNYKEYARHLNINPDADMQWVCNAVIDCTVFCHWEDEEYQEFISVTYANEDVIKALHTQYINSVCGSIEERIDELVKFFYDVATGKNDKLLLYGSQFERAGADREVYIEEDDVDYIPMSDEEFKQRLGSIKNLLPSGAEIAPDIYALDDEIYAQAGIVAVRDDSGKFLSGQQVVLKPKNIYSDLYPKLFCNTCYAARTCPDFKSGMVCAYKNMFKRFDTRNERDIAEAMHSMVNMNLERLQLASIFEKLDGGLPNAAVTQMIDQNVRLLANIKAMHQAQNMEVLTQTRVVKSDGSSEERVQVQNPQEGGILQQLLSSLSKRKSPEEEADEFKDMKEEPDVVEAPKTETVPKETPKKLGSVYQELTPEDLDQAGIEEVEIKP